MATKFIAMLKSLGSNKSEKDVKTLMSERREREKTLMSKTETMLSDIQYSNNIKLPQDKIKEYKVESRLARMRKVLETEMVTKVDTEELDNLIIKFADSLKLALEQNLPNMAYWSSVALHKAVESLRLETPDLYAKDPVMEVALYNQKVMYANTLSNIITLAQKQDHLEVQMNDQQKEIDRKQTERDNRQKAYDLMHKTKQGQALVVSMRSKNNNLAAMTKEEKAVYENEKRIASLRSLLASDYAQLEVYDTNLTAILNDIETSRVQLLQEPDIDDEKLAAKIKEANRIFREKMTKQLDDAYLSMIAFDEHITNMEELLKHPAIKLKYAKIAAAIEEMENERIEQKLAALEAQRKMNRDIQNAMMIQTQEKELEKELEEEIQKIVDTMTDTDTDTDTESDTETDTESETETEYEYDL